jgi:hypothetical protein
MENQPEVLAQHYTEAGIVEKSVACWGKAGRRSAARSAMAEAAAQLQKGLNQLKLLPDTPERWRQELEFCSALGAVLHAVKGYAAPETGHAYARARVLWEQLGSPLEFLQVPYGQSVYHMGRGELDVAQGLNEDLLRLSRQRNDSAGLVLGHLSSGRDLMLVGRFTPSRSHFEEVIALYDPNSPRSISHHEANCPRVSSQAYSAIVLFCLGFPDQALAKSSAAIAEALRLAHPLDLPRFRGEVRAWDQSSGWGVILSSSFVAFFGSTPKGAILPSRPARWCGRRAERRSRTAPSWGRPKGLSLTVASTTAGWCASGSPAST